MSDKRSVPKNRVNELWKIKKLSNPRLFDTGADLIEEAHAYFRWCDEHPRYKNELVKYKDGTELVEVPMRRPYTMDGLTVFLQVSPAYFRGAKQQIQLKIDAGRADERDLDFLEAIHHVEGVVRGEQIEGGLVGQYKEQLIARLNCLADNVNNHNTGDATINISVRDEKTAGDLEALNALL